MLPAYLRDPSGEVVAEKLRDRADELAEALGPKVHSGDVGQIRRVLVEVGRSYIDYRVVAQREAEQQAELADVPEALVSVPYFDTDVYDLEGLLRLGAKLWSP